MIDRVAELADLARPMGLTIAFEPVSFADYSTLDQAADILRAVDRDNVQVLVDTLHFHFARTRVQQIAALPADWFPYVHVADGPAEVPAARDELRRIAREERLCPGEGAIGLRTIVEALPAGLLCGLEVPNQVMVKALGADAYARRVLAAARAVLD